MVTFLRHGLVEYKLEIIILQISTSNQYLKPFLITQCLYVFDENAFAFHKLTKMTFKCSL